MDTSVRPSLAGLRVMPDEVACKFPGVSIAHGFFFHVGMGEERGVGGVVDVLECLGLLLDLS